MIRSICHKCMAILKPLAFSCGACGALVLATFHADVTTAFAPQHVSVISAPSSNPGDPNDEARPVVTQPPQAAAYSATASAGFRVVEQLSFPYGGGSVRTL